MTSKFSCWPASMPDFRFSHRGPWGRPQRHVVPYLAAALFLGISTWLFAQDVDVDGSRTLEEPSQQVRTFNNRGPREVVPPPPDPAEATVRRAVLAVHAPKESAGGIQPVEAVPALRSWTDGRTWWTNWGRGGNDPGYAGDTIVCRGPVGVLGKTYFVLDPVVVQRWVDSPESNHTGSCFGALKAMTGSIGVRMALAANIHRH